MNEKKFTVRPEIEVNLSKQAVDDERTYIVTEMCPRCESEIEMRWDTDTMGFKAFCPLCLALRPQLHRLSSFFSSHHKMQRPAFRGYCPGCQCAYAQNIFFPKSVFFTASSLVEPIPVQHSILPEPPGMQHHVSKEY